MKADRWELAALAALAFVGGVLVAWPDPAVRMIEAVADWLAAHTPIE